MTTTTNLWICSDCHKLAETGESSAHAESAKPLGLVEESTLVFAGADLGDAGIDFDSTDPCPGCGSKLIGVRFLYAKV